MERCTAAIVEAIQLKQREEKRTLREAQIRSQQSGKGLAKTPGEHKSQAVAGDDHSEMDMSVISTDKGTESDVELRSIIGSHDSSSDHSISSSSESSDD